MLRIRLILLLILINLLGITPIESAIFSNPKGLNYQSDSYYIDESQIDFMYDLTFSDTEGNIHYSQEIFDTILAHIKTAESYILIDMFLFNNFAGKDDNFFRDISEELTEALIAQKAEYPNIKIDFITDPINLVYGGSKNQSISSLRKAGINVIITDLNKLRDSNYIWSPFWRVLFQWFDNSKSGGILPNPFTADDSVTFRTYFRMLNFKANHRKIFVADHPQRSFVTIITSANPHNGSAAHSNIAVQITGDFANEVIHSERVIAKFSDNKLHYSHDLKTKQEDLTEEKRRPIKIKLLTESKIKKRLLKEIKKTTAQDSIKMAMFYLSDRDVISYLGKASKRGVSIQIILDPSKDAFGYKKNGVPNRAVANELKKDSDNNIDIRWYNTHGEQFHSKITIFKRKQNSTFILGSANLTKRNIDDYNLETDLYVVAENSTDFSEEIFDYYNKIWFNYNDFSYSIDYESYEDRSFFKKLLYRIQHFTGAGTF